MKPVIASEPSESSRRIAVIGNHLPRRCGIATFTTDVCDALEAARPGLECLVVAMNDRTDGYAYPPRVRATIDQHDLAQYRRAADFLNVNEIDAVLVQHEFGLFGGAAGEYVLALLRDLKAPVVSVLHTVLKEPGPEIRRVTEGLLDLSDRVVVLSERGRRFLTEVYDADPERVDLVHHGVPDVPFLDPAFHKDAFGVEGRFVLLTFGLLSPNKGVEHAIEAVARLVPRHPEVVYLVVGQTHPHVRREQGESYRMSLERLAHDLGVAEHVVFHDRFVDLDELVRFISAADVYLTPYLTREQIVSGTLAYTLGAGKAIVSTPYWYAEEMLAGGRGVLVPFADPAALAEAIEALIEDETERHRMRKRAYEFGRRMIWPAVARETLHVLDRALHDRGRRARPVRILKPISASGRRTLPVPDLSHLKRMTDSTGLLQHAVFDVPNPNEGYTTDDNARALLLAVRLEEIGHDVDTARELERRYVAFLLHAFDRERGLFRNVLRFDRTWAREPVSEDCQGRAIWALGATVAHARAEGIRAAANRLLEDALPVVERLEFPRALAFAILGLGEHLDRVPGDHRARDLVRRLAAPLLERHRSCASEDWPWFEDECTYANARLPHALLRAGVLLEDGEMVERALRALTWLGRIQTSEDGWFSPIGNDGFLRRGGQKARFDQQPIEAEAHVSACLEAARVTGDDWWRQEARRAFDWFLGRNDVGVPLADPSTGGCRDGLHADRANGNQGAESTLAYLLSLVETMRNRADGDRSESGRSPARGAADAPAREQTGGAEGGAEA